MRRCRRVFRDGRRNDDGLLRRHFLDCGFFRHRLFGGGLFALGGRRLAFRRGRLRLRGRLFSLGGRRFFLHHAIVGRLLVDRNLRRRLGVLRGIVRRGWRGFFGFVVVLRLFAGREQTRRQQSSAQTQIFHDRPQIGGFRALSPKVNPVRSVTRMRVSFHGAVLRCPVGVHTPAWICVRCDGR